MGYEPVMPTYAGRIKDREITSIIAYLKSRSQFAEEEPATGDAEDAAPTEVR